MPLVETVTTGAPLAAAPTTPELESVVRCTLPARRAVRETLPAAILTSLTSSPYFSYRLNSLPTQSGARLPVKELYETISESSLFSCACAQPDRVKISSNEIGSMRRVITVSLFQLQGFNLARR